MTGPEAERAAVALELHDLLFHRLSALSIQASGAATRLQDQLPGPAESFRQIAESAGEALLELRGLGYAMGTAPVAMRTPQPDLSSLPELLQRWRALGARVAIRTGELPDRVPGAVALAVVRLLETAVTSALGEGTPLRAEVRAAGHTLVLELHRPAAGLTDRDLLARMRARASAVGATISQRNAGDLRITRVTFPL